MTINDQIYMYVGSELLCRAETIAEAHELLRVVAEQGLELEESELAKSGPNSQCLFVKLKGERQ